MSSTRPPNHLWIRNERSLNLQLTDGPAKRYIVDERKSKKAHKAKRKVYNKIQHIAVTQRLLVAQTAFVAVIVASCVCSCCRAILFLLSGRKTSKRAGSHDRCLGEWAATWRQCQALTFYSQRLQVGYIFSIAPAQFGFMQLLCVRVCFKRALKHIFRPTLKDCTATYTTNQFLCQGAFNPHLVVLSLKSATACFFISSASFLHMHTRLLSVSDHINFQAA